MVPTTKQGNSNMTMTRKEILNLKGATDRAKIRLLDENGFDDISLDHTTDNEQVSPIKLSKEQQLAYDGITQLFEHSNEPKAALLTGAAGTGKTFLCDQLAKTLNPVLCALTHKACSVLADATGEDVYTLAKILKQRKFNDYTNGSTQFRSTGNITLPDNKKTIFIDESSMMNKANFEQVVDNIMETYNVLFIGDKFQLPPINERETKAFTLDVARYELLTPQRYREDSGINATALTVRKALQDGKQNIYGMQDILANPKFQDVLWLTADEAVPMMIEDFKHITDVDDVRVISFTNKRVEQFNYHLKLAITGHVEKFCPGDVLMANETYTEDVTMDNGRTEQVIRLQNNQSVIVKEVEEVVINGLPCYAMVVSNDVRVNVPVNRLLFEQRVQDLRTDALGVSGKERSMRFRKMFEFKEQFADLRLNLAQTVHKAQGSTYQTCYFDLESLNSKTEMGKKLLYTGVTRAARRLVLFK